MHDPHLLAATIAELRSLGGTDRRAILAALPAEERARAEALLQEGVKPGMAEAAAPAAPALSPWLAERLAEGDGRITPATRAALRKAMGESGAAPGSGTADAAPRGRSLLGGMAALLGRTGPGL